MPFPPPYEEIADLLRQGQVIPFLGAGASLGNRPPKVSWDAATSTFLPRGDELSLWLAKVINFPSKKPHDRSNLAKVSSYYAEVSARERLLERLRTVFKDRSAPCDIHHFLAELAKSAEIAQSGDSALVEHYRPLKANEFKPLLIVTTNYDVMTEIALKELECRYDLVVHPTEQKERAGSVMWWKHGATKPDWIRPHELPIDLDTTTVVYKMHGTVLHPMSEVDSYVITEEDYVEFLSLMAVPPLFISHFYSRQFLFIGYGLGDWNFRVMLKNLRDKPKSGNVVTADNAQIELHKAMSQDSIERKELKSWAIQTKPSVFEDVLWRARDVALMDEDINEFVKALREKSKTLISHMNSNR